MEVQTHTENASLRDVDVRAAIEVDGWRDISEDGGELRGTPPVGLRRPVVRYTRDLGKASRLAKKAALAAARKKRRAEIVVRFTAGEIMVEASDQHGALFLGACTRVDGLAEVVTKCALAVVSAASAGK